MDLHRRVERRSELDDSRTLSGNGCRGRSLGHRVELMALVRSAGVGLAVKSNLEVFGGCPSAQAPERKLRGELEFR